MDGSTGLVILVHGWNSHPGIWNRLTVRLDGTGIPYRRFDYTGLCGASLPEIAAALGKYIDAVRSTTGSTENLDLVCHSVGTCAARYLLEVMDGRARQHRVRQLIGLGPPNCSATRSSAPASSIA